MGIPKRNVGLFAGIVGIAASIPVQASVIYQNDFQSGAGSEWSRTFFQNTPTPYWFGPRTFLGEFGNETVSLSLASLSAHSGVRLDFDLYLIRSWDGSSGGAALYDYGNDVFSVMVQGGVTLLEETFSNGNPAGQTYGAGTNNPAYTGTAETYSLGFIFNDGILGISQVMDSVYRLSLNFAHRDNWLAFEFGGQGLQDLGDESWGLDNVQVSLLGTQAPAPIPAPSILPLVGIGFLGMLWAQRRKTQQQETGVHSPEPTQNGI